MVRDSNGFSLIEILIALFIGAMVYGLYQAGTYSGRRNLERFSDLLERSIRFSLDEATLRNTMMRIRFHLDKIPQEFGVEFGPSDNFILPPSKIREKTVLSLEEKEKAVNQQKAIDKKFMLVEEFQEENREVPENIRIIGVGTSYNKEFITENQASIYFYPSGEKDSAIIILGAYEELLAITIDSFIMNIEKTFRTFEYKNLSQEEVEVKQLELAKELFDDWIGQK